MHHSVVADMRAAKVEHVEIRVVPKVDHALVTDSSIPETQGDKVVHPSQVGESDVGHRRAVEIEALDIR